jgi:hypothetical protein
MRFAFTLSKSCLMRCMMCGDKMVLTEAMPAEAGGVQGFEIQTHHCPACRGTERRLYLLVGRPTSWREGSKLQRSHALLMKLRSLTTLMGQIKRRHPDTSCDCATPASPLALWWRCPVCSKTAIRRVSTLAAVCDGDTIRKVEPELVSPQSSPAS